jgi:hypothetical protein
LAVLTCKELVKHRSSGLTIRFYGKNGDRTYELPAVYIDDYLSVLEEGGYTGLK